ncbi:type VII toxin-antitoxin system MntA family adenylyltransferase antitoxin [Haloarchaeobius litoreus]|uniref:Nucleotidyltransferase family protein n=1 Tax=Haloarchaeobius litoreus TaxID=755306 RepID=A0ABD6DP40_9EURY|nr:nucleotidyltransferase domain-containing protein [Haloarchaeobius litoreus]
MKNELPGDAEINLEALESSLREHPVRFAILFGSHATGEAHPSSDIDIAVELSGVQPSDPAFNDAFLGLSADLSETLQTDEVDLVEVHTVSPELADSILSNGVILVGDERIASSRLRELAKKRSKSKSPRERLDTAISNINAHLDDDTDSQVPASGKLDSDQ